MIKDNDRRDWFAGLALIGLMIVAAIDEDDLDTTDGISERAYWLADAMMKARTEKDEAA